MLLTTKGATPLTEFTFGTEDVLMLGRESAGVPDSVHEICDARVRIPIAPGLRSLNIAVAAGVALERHCGRRAGFRVRSLGKRRDEECEWQSCRWR